MSFTILIGILILVSVNCYAIQFSQPVKIGWFAIQQAGRNGGGFVAKNASHNSGNYFTKSHADNKGSYEKGVAIFGNGADALYVHYNVNDRKNVFLVGGKEKNNTISNIDPLTNEVIKISTNAGLTIYALFSEYGPDKDYLVIGRQKNGKFVKYFDTIDITKRYFGMKSNGMSPVIFKDIITQTDTIIIKYANMGNPKNKIIGEFRFKWDEKAQWFGIEQVVY